MRLTSRKARISAWSVLLRIWVRCKFLRHNVAARELCHRRTACMQQSCQSQAARHPLQMLCRHEVHTLRVPMSRCNCVADMDYTASPLWLTDLCHGHNVSELSSLAYCALKVSVSQVCSACCADAAVTTPTCSQRAGAIGALCQSKSKVTNKLSMSCFDCDAVHKQQWCPKHAASERCLVACCAAATVVAQTCRQ